MILHPAVERMATIMEDIGALLRWEHELSLPDHEYYDWFLEEVTP